MVVLPGTMVREAKAIRPSRVARALIGSILQSPFLILCLELAAWRARLTRQKSTPTRTASTGPSALDSGDANGQSDTEGTRLRASPALRLPESHLHSTRPSGSGASINAALAAAQAGSSA